MKGGSIDGCAIDGYPPGLVSSAGFWVCDPIPWVFFIMVSQHDCPNPLCSVQKDLIVEVGCNLSNTGPHGSQSEGRFVTDLQTSS